MGWEWLPVAGTLGGAAIGGGVTLLKGRQDAAAADRAADRDDQRRKDDREWDRRLHGADERRALYSRLHAKALNIDTSIAVLGFVVLTRPGKEHEAEHEGAAVGPRRHLVEYQEVVAEVAMAAYDHHVLAKARAYGRAALDALTATLFSQDDRVEKSAALRPLIDELEATCRRDLGLNADPPAG